MVCTERNEDSIRCEIDRIVRHSIDVRIRSLCMCVNVYTLYFQCSCYRLLPTFILLADVAFGYFTCVMMMTTTAAAVAAATAAMTAANVTTWGSFTVCVCV